MRLQWFLNCNDQALNKDTKIGALLELQEGVQNSKHSNKNILGLEGSVRNSLKKKKNVTHTNVLVCPKRTEFDYMNSSTVKIQEVHDTFCPRTFFTFISDCHPHITQKQVGLRIRSHYTKIEEQCKDYLHFTCDSGYPTCCKTLHIKTQPMRRLATSHPIYLTWALLSTLLHAQLHVAQIV